MRGATGLTGLFALRALVLRAGFALAVETDGADLADAGIWMLAFGTLILYMRSLDSLPLSPNT